MPKPSVEQSRIKMNAYLMEEAQRPWNCLVWFNYPEKNKLSDQEIIKGMLQRLQKHALFEYVKIVQFYYVDTQALIVEYKANHR